MIWSAVISGPAPSGMKSRSTSSASDSCTVRAGQAGERGHPDQGALELADRVRDPGGDELEHVVGGVHPLLRGLLLQDRDAGLEVRRLDVGEQAPLEAGAHPVFQRGQLPRRAVRADHDLLVRVVQRVEGVEELLLRALAVLQELDVVDQQDVDVAVAPLEGLGLVVPQAS